MSENVDSQVAASAVQRRLNLNPAFTTILILLPFTVVCIFLHRFVLAALFPMVGLVLLVLARPAQRRRPDALLVVSALAGCVLLLFLLFPILNLLLTTDGGSMIAMARDRSVDLAIDHAQRRADFDDRCSRNRAPLGYVLARVRFPGKAIVEGIIDMPSPSPKPSREWRSSSSSVGVACWALRCTPTSGSNSATPSGELLWRCCSSAFLSWSTFRAMAL